MNEFLNEREIDNPALTMGILNELDSL